MRENKENKRATKRGNVAGHNLSASRGHIHQGSAIDGLMRRHTLLPPDAPVRPFKLPTTQDALKADGKKAIIWGARNVKRLEKQERESERGRGGGGIGSGG